MSWEPAWAPDGRGGFHRTRTASEEEGEVEEEGQVPAAPAAVSANSSSAPSTTTTSVETSSNNANRAMSTTKEAPGAAAAPSLSIQVPSSSSSGAAGGSAGMNSNANTTSNSGPQASQTSPVPPRRSSFGGPPSRGGMGGGGRHNHGHNHGHGLHPQHGHRHSFSGMPSPRDRGSGPPPHERHSSFSGPPSSSGGMHGHNHNHNHGHNNFGGGPRDRDFNGPHPPFRGGGPPRGDRDSFNNGPHPPFGRDRDRDRDFDGPNNMNNGPPPPFRDGPPPPPRHGSFSRGPSREFSYTARQDSFGNRGGGPNSHNNSGNNEGASSYSVLGAGPHPSSRDFDSSRDNNHNRPFMDRPEPGPPPPFSREGSFGGATRPTDPRMRRGSSMEGGSGPFPDGPSSSGTVGGGGGSSNNLNMPANSNAGGPIRSYSLLAEQPPSRSPTHLRRTLSSGGGPDGDFHHRGNRGPTDHRRPPWQQQGPPGVQSPKLARSTSANPSSSPMPPTQQDNFDRSRDWTPSSAGAGGTGVAPAAKMLRTQSVPVVSSSQPEVPSIEKKAPAEPLLTSALGDAQARAEKAVQHLKELVSSYKGQSNELPSKQLIMKAISELDTQLKESTKLAETLVEEKQTLQQEEEEQERAVKQAKEKAIEEKRLAKQRRLEAYAEEDAAAKAAGLAEGLKQRQGEIDQIQASLKAELQGTLAQRKEEEADRLSKQMEESLRQASQQLEDNIVKAQNDLAKAKATTEKWESKVLAAQAQYEQARAEEAREMAEEEKEETQKPGMPDFVTKIQEENRRKAREAQLLSLSIIMPENEKGDIGLGVDEAATSETRDPKFGRTAEEWSILTQKVTGQSDALYSKPSDAPYFEQIEKTNAAIGPSVKEYIRDRKQRLMGYWTELAEEYEVRKRLYEQEEKAGSRKVHQEHRKSAVGRQSIVGKVSEGDFDRKGSAGSTLETTPGGRSTANPYRRARRGNEVRSEYEQEQIIAEIAAKEAMERRITHGGSKLPRQVCRIEREMTANYFNTFTSQRVDPAKEAEQESNENIWSDMEKCIFLDRFLQFPKDFKRIASFLRNKTTRDCVRFYYDSKQMVPYKGALKEHTMRRKRKEAYQVWDASIQAAMSVGATVEVGESEEKPVVFVLPKSDCTYATRLLHPLKREVFDGIELDPKMADYEDDESPTDQVKWRNRKRGREPLFLLDDEQTKYLKQASQETMSNARSSVLSLDELGEQSKSTELDATGNSTSRKTPQKWTSDEKKLFMETLEKHGRNWSVLSDALGNKTITQIKNYYYDIKKQAGKGKEKKAAKDSGEASSTGAAKKQKKTGAPRGRPRKKPKPNTLEEANGAATHHETARKSASRMQDSENLKETMTNENARTSASIPSSQPADPNSEMIQQLLRQQQLQQEQQQAQHGGVSAIQQLLRNQQRGGNTPPVSAADDALRMYQQQRLQQEQQSMEDVQRIVQLQAAGQISADEARRLLQLHQAEQEQLAIEEQRRRQQSQQHQQVLSNFFPMLGGQAGIQEALAAAALQRGDMSGLQNLLHLQQQQQHHQQQFGQPNAQLAQLLALSRGNPGGLPYDQNNELAALGMLGGYGGPALQSSNPLIQAAARGDRSVDDAIRSFLASRTGYGSGGTSPHPNNPPDGQQGDH